MPVAEYLLMTEPFYRRVDARAAGAATTGARSRSRTSAARTPGTSTSPSVEPATPAPMGFGARLARHVRLTWRSLPYFIGRRRACEGFRNVDLRHQAAR